MHLTARWKSSTLLLWDLGVNKGNCPATNRSLQANPGHLLEARYKSLCLGSQTLQVRENVATCGLLFDNVLFVEHV